MAGTWHYLRDGEQTGPVSQEEFYTLVQHGVITGDTKVWCEGWSHWVSYSEYTASQDLQNTAANAQKKGGGKGLIIGLSLGGGLLVIGVILMFVLMSGPPTCESACANAVAIVGEDEEWDEDELAEQRSECMSSCLDKDNDGEKAWTADQRSCIGSVASQKELRVCFEERGKRVAKTTEAIDMLDKIYKGAAYYYTAPKVSRTGSKLPCQFPADQGVTPGAATCCAMGAADVDKDDRCDSNPDAWTTVTWAALSFQMNDQHYYTYSFDSEGTGANAIFTASAYGDLDCDSTFSTFQRLGYGDPQATGSECAMRGSAAFYVENETE